MMAEAIQFGPQSDLPQLIHSFFGEEMAQRRLEEERRQVVDWALKHSLINLVDLPNLAEMNHVVDMIRTFIRKPKLLFTRAARRLKKALARIIPFLRNHVRCRNALLQKILKRWTNVEAFQRSKTLAKIEKRLEKLSKYQRATAPVDPEDMKMMLRVYIDEDSKKKVLLELYWEHFRSFSDSWSEGYREGLALAELPKFTFNMDNATLMGQAMFDRVQRLEQREREMLDRVQSREKRQRERQFSTDFPSPTWIDSEGIVSRLSSAESTSPPECSSTAGRPRWYETYDGVGPIQVSPTSSRKQTVSPPTSYKKEEETAKALGPKLPWPLISREIEIRKSLRRERATRNEMMGDIEGMHDDSVITRDPSVVSLPSLTLPTSPSPARGTPPRGLMPYHASKLPVAPVCPTIPKHEYEMKHRPRVRPHPVPSGGPRGKYNLNLVHSRLQRLGLFRQQSIEYQTTGFLESAQSTQSLYSLKGLFM